MLRRAEGRGISSVVADILRQPFFSRSFDVIVASFVLNHVIDCRVAVLELRRLLRPAGQLAFTSWARGPSENALGDAWNAVASRWIKRDQVQMAVTQALPSEAKLTELGELEAVVRDAGLCVTQSLIIDLPVRMSMSSYLESRCIAMTSRFMMTELNSDKWNAFKKEAAASLVSRFGESAAFSTKVNMVVAQEGRNHNEETRGHGDTGTRRGRKSLRSFGF
jgi:SAM-dependent methyltransferase